MFRIVMKTRAARALVLVALATTLLPGFGTTAHSQTPAAGGDGTGCDPTAATPIPQPTQAELEAAGLGALDLAPDSARRDLVAGPFSDSTAVTNPLFPIADLHSAILNGHVDGKPFYTETTLLPFTRIIEWTPGQCLRVLISQYTAFLDGRITEVAIDLYAQADDGSVWYLGEDVYDYDPAGRVAATEGTWHAGTEGPGAMIMPADPQVGDASRPENIPGLVFEEVIVTQVDQIFEGPSGPVSGGIVGTEMHQDGSLSDKLFAPGYGEFLSRESGDLEALALASPTDALPGGVPDELSAMSVGSGRIFDSPLRTAGQWRGAEATATAIADAWDAFRAGPVPPRLVRPTRLALEDLAERIDAHDRSGTWMASIDVAYASVNLQLRYRPVAEVDAIRFALWARRAQVDALDESLGGVRSDHVTLEWIRDRFVHTLDSVTRARIDALLGELGAAVVDRDLDAAADASRSLVGVVDGLA